MGGAHGPVVVKFGGSFAGSSLLRDWIKAFAECSGRIVLVPGGGPFADVVRSTQSEIGFDDRAAHHMALLAMEQYGRALLSLDRRLAAADSADGIQRELTAGRVPVWMPSRMTIDAADLAPSWDVTSDSLAAWLTGKIGASRLFLIKRVGLPAARVRCDDLAAKGIVDRDFVRHFRSGSFAAFLFGPTDSKALVAAIQGGSGGGAAVE
jgi:5-(aminomethyl)-3-furanmethanol phosphate kinase